MPNKKKNKSKLGSAASARLKQIQLQKQREKERIRQEKEAERLEEERFAEEERLAEEKKKQAQVENGTKPKKKKTAAQKKRDQKLRLRREALLRQSGGKPGKMTTVVKKEEPVVEKTLEKLHVNEDLRSPICCVLGHVDTGKTKLLDYIRKTNVQDKEVGGITQQIGASYFPIENIRKRTLKISGKLDIDYQLPGLLVIDTPGHETFSNLRKRGSSLCDVAILVVDIMHGLEQQTLESIEILQKAKVPFVIALNKIDRLVNWKSTKDAYIEDTLENQSKKTLDHFETRLKDIKYKLAQHSVNALPYYNNKQKKKILSIVPVSAITGEGIPDLLALIMFLTQKWMSKSLTLIGGLDCSVMEVKTERGIGSTIDVILSNGILREHDKIILATLNGPVITSIRGLLTPQPLHELRVKNEYLHHKEIKASMGIKIIGNDLEHVIAGTKLFKIRDTDTEDQIERKKRKVMQDVEDIMNSFELDDSKGGVYVKTSTLGSLEALITLLKNSDVPISLAGIGNLTKKDIMKASALRDDTVQHSDNPVILAFNIKPDKEIELLAAKENVTIFSGEIVYNLVDMYTRHRDAIVEEKKKDSKENEIYPCVLKILPQFIFNKKSPLVFGVKIMDGQLHKNTPITIPEKDIVLGKITSIQKNSKEISKTKVGDEVCIKIENHSTTDDAENQPMQYTYGRQFDENDILYSKITRESIDYMKKYHKSTLNKQEWMLIVKLKKIFQIK